MLQFFKNIRFSEIISSSGLLAKAIAGGVLVFFGMVIMFALVFLPQSWIGSKSDFFSLIALLSLVLGNVFLLWAARSLRQLQNNLLEMKTLKIAKSNGGILTIDDLVLKMSVSTSVAEKLLKQMHYNGLAEIGTNENGVLRFKFSDLST